ncbi:hypothetical protein GH714_030898 [Hevea brasiliensis]|uniref:Transposase-associated domain-containing protein n=1 Tax=Hevea brasiliensis TaxID=3981 RepID=A0A6A6KMQ1_HEVBR|nr:hypothetical protein GH714_030898 [Hevea brasiliensis]
MLNKNKFSSEYIQGVRSFLDVAKQHVDSSGRIRCPCKNCNNCYLKKVAEVKQDLFLHGFVEDYTQWTHHGESFESDVGIHLGDSHDDDNLSDQVKDRHDNTFEMLKDMCNSNFTEFSAERPSSNHETTSSEKEVEKFARLLNDAQCELYPVCTRKNFKDKVLLMCNIDIRMNFHLGLRNVVQKNLRGSLESTNHLYVLGLGPDMRVTKYSGIIVNGIRFHNIERDKYRHTQNSGIVVKGEQNSEEIDFYGELTDIIELEYCHGNCVYVFKCNWWNIGDKKNGSRTYGQLMSVNVNRKWYVDDPFVLANQASQAFYINDIKNGSGWKIVQKSYPRNVYDVPENEE